MPNFDNQQIVFLGVADRANLEREGPFAKWNVLGFKQIIPTFITPLSLAGINLAFALRIECAQPTYDLRVRSSDGEEYGTVKIKMQAVSRDPASSPIETSEGILTQPILSGWLPIFYQMNNPCPVIQKAGQCLVVHVHEDGVEELVGSFDVVLIDPLPLTPERISAIKSDPHAAKAIKVSSACTKCSDTYGVYAALEKSPTLEGEGLIWYEDVPDERICKCGSSKVDLRTIKRNLGGALGGALLGTPDIGFIPRYEQTSISALEASFKQLLDADPTEELLQKFIEKNPILLHQFPAIEIFHKPPILTQFKADFAILGPHKELTFIEIETTKTKILTQNGHAAASLTHAFGQVEESQVEIVGVMLRILDG